MQHRKILMYLPIFGSEPKILHNLSEDTRLSFLKVAQCNKLSTLQTKTLLASSSELRRNYRIWAAVFNFSAKLSCVLVMLDKYSNSSWSCKANRNNNIRDLNTINIDNPASNFSIFNNRGITKVGSRLKKKYMDWMAMTFSISYLITYQIIGDHVILCVVHRPIS